MSDTVIGTWTLGATGQSPATSHLLIGRTTTSSEEATFDDDNRQLVDAKDRSPGGTYYSIVKLQIHYENQAPDDQRYAQGTGWLIRPDLLVTAGHCVFDHTYHFGRATEVKAYLGYNGKASIGSANVQFRRGKKIATTKGWVSSEVNRDCDVAFIQLDQPFDNVDVFQFQPTPTRGILNLEVVGYPADKSLDDERAAQMYHMSKNVAFSLDTATLHMLEYTISTYAGQSGSPVLIKGTKTAIGAHVYGLGETNSASVIRGVYGNYYRALSDVFTRAFPAYIQAAGVTYIKVPVINTEDDLSDVPHTDAEGFFDTLKSIANTAANIGSKVLQVGSPFLGPVGGPIAAISGTVLGFVSKATESSLDDPSLPNTIEYKAHCYRAVAGEAALQTALKMKPSQLNKYGIFENMRKTYTKNRQIVPVVAKAIGPALLEPAVRIAVMNTSHDAVTQNESAFPIVAAPPSTESTMDDQSGAFVKALNDEAHARGMEEGFLDFLTPLLKTSVQITPTNLKVIGGLLGSGGESGFDIPKDDLQPHYEIVCHRALMGEAAFQAIMAIPPEQLQQEGFFGDMLGTIKTIGATVVKAAPGVIKTVLPIVTAVLEKNSGSSPANPPPAQAERPNTGGKPNKPSEEESLLDSLLGNNSEGSGGPTNSFSASSPTLPPSTLPPQLDGLSFDA